jgi:hypothetical protein
MSPRRHGRGQRGAEAAVATAPGVALPLAGADAAVSTDGVGAPPNGTRDATNRNAPNNVAPHRGARSQGNTGQRPEPQQSQRSPVDVPVEAAEPGGARASCTLAQMRRFIKSRPYVPVHELRRRFEIDGLEDEVSPMATERGTLYVGLPMLEAGFLGELVKAGEVGCELLLDPAGPGVVGVYPMRPVARQ